MIFSNEQKEILDGLMLGDGNLSIGGKCINARLRINRSFEDYEYSNWILEVFKIFCTKKSLGIKTVFDGRYNKNYKSIYFYTKRNYLFTEYFNRWYKNGNKILPKNLKLTSLVIAIWFADDGTIYENGKKLCIYKI